MPSRATKPADETAAANRRALYSGTVGAAKWGIVALALGLTGHLISPIYRSLTPQFKVYLQLSATTVGAVLGAERGVRSFEFEMLREKRRRKNEGIWENYQNLLEKEKELERAEDRESEGVPRPD